MQELRASRGTVYLIHFNRPLKHARHYLGWTSNLRKRLNAHEDGTGSVLLRALAERGIGWKLVRTWDNAGLDVERKLKKQGSRARLCPLCQGKGVPDGRVA